MGSPTKTQCESLTDALVARIQKDIDGYRSEYAAQTLASLADLVDGLGDLDVEDALLGVSLAVDRHSTPELIRDWLPGICQRTAYSAWCNAFNTLVKSAAGGSHASLRAYLVAVSAKIHPLAAEAFRRLLAETCFTVSDVVAGVSNPTYSAIFPSAIYTGADGSLVDDLTDAIDVGTADVALFATDDFALYIGSDRPFQGVCIALSTLASADIAATFQYWNGSAWATLTVTDSTVGLTKNSLISFTAPADWSRAYKDSGGTAFANLARLYYIRIARTGDALVTPPVASTITLIPTAIVNSSGGTAHVCGVEQPPLAICVITAASTMTVTLPASIDTTRWAAPLGTENKLRLRALTPIAQDLTVTLAYTDTNGANDSQAQSAWTAPASLATAVVALNTGDTLKSVRTTSSVSTSAVAGVFAVEALPIREPAV